MIQPSTNLQQPAQDPPAARPANAPQRVVILGAGFGGIYTAFHLEKAAARGTPVEVTLINRDNYFLMTPLLFEAGSGVLEPRHAVQPIRPMLKNVKFIEAVVEGVDFNQRVITARHEPGAEAYHVPYDQLVVALGGVTNRAIIPGSDLVLAFKTLADGIFVRNRVIDLFEQATVETDPARKRMLLTVVVVGGGLVGVELVGEMTEFLRNLARGYPNIDYDRDVKLLLVEAGPKILPEMERELADYAVKTLRDRGVEVLTGTPVQKLEITAAHLPGRVVSAGTIVLAAGVAANPLLKDLPLEKGKGGRLVAEGTMRIKDHPNVWALGDCALIPGPDGKPYPQLAQHALREAKVLARNIVASFHDGKLEPFVYESMGTLASLGRFKGVGRVTKFKIYGLPAWFVWRTYYLMQMPQLNRRFRIMLDWFVALFFRNDVVKLDLSSDVQGKGQSRPTTVQREAILSR